MSGEWFNAPYSPCYACGENLLKPAGPLGGATPAPSNQCSCGAITPVEKSLFVHIQERVRAGIERLGNSELKELVRDPNGYVSKWNAQKKSPKLFVGPLNDDSSPEGGLKSSGRWLKVWSETVWMN